MKTKRPTTSRIEEINAKVQALRAEAAGLKAKERQATRKQEDAQAFLLGRWLQHQLKSGHQVPALASWDELVAAVEPYLTRDYDRQRFGLPAKNPAD